MQLAMIGLGKMGANMTARLLGGGHQVVVYDRSSDAVAASVANGAVGGSSLDDVVAKVGAAGTRVVWIMVPSGAPTQSTIDALAALLAPGDVIIDGGNSNYKDSIARHDALAVKGIHFLDCGMSGGVWGLANGYCLMVGGPTEAATRCEPIFTTLAPKDGYLHVDAKPGAGHFTKMVHNGIEYSMMAAYGEGLEIIEKSPFDVDQAKLTAVWGQGSVVRSWLLELLAGYLAEHQGLEDLEAFVEDSGEGRWTVDAAVEFGAPAYTIAASLFARFASRENDAYGLRVVAALRNAFGGHAVKPAP